MILTKIFICVYWIVLIMHNIYTYSHMDAEKRNIIILALILVNAIVIILTFIEVMNAI